MSTALTLRQNAAVDTSRRVMTPMSFDDLVSMGDQLVRTGFLPAHIKDGAQCAAIVLTGQELGMQPMRAIRSLAMVKGKVVESADSQLARFKSDGGHAVFKELTDTRAVLWLRHPNGDEHTETYTLEMARAAGLAGQDNYKKHPKAMLRSRAITAGLKSIGWEGGTGIYDPSEAVSFTNGDQRPANVTEDGEEREPTYDEAYEYLLPGKPNAWGGHGGQTLGSLSRDLLASVGKWAAAQGEKENGYARADELLTMVNVILAGDEGQAEPTDQTEFPAALTDEPDDLPFPADTRLAPGTVQSLHEVERAR